MKYLFLAAIALLMACDKGSNSSSPGSVSSIDGSWILYVADYCSMGVTIDGANYTKTYLCITATNSDLSTVYVNISGESGTIECASDSCEYTISQTSCKGIKDQEANGTLEYALSGDKLWVKEGSTSATFSRNESAGDDSTNFVFSWGCFVDGVFTENDIQQLKPGTYQDDFLRSLAHSTLIQLLK